MTFGNLLNKARQANGLNLSDVAKATGIAATNLHRMEVGTRPPPAGEKIESIMRAIRMDARSSQLLRWLVTHDMPETLAALALHERTIPLEDFESAALMRWVEINPEHISKAAWFTVVKRIEQTRDAIERAMALTVTATKEGK